MKTDAIVASALFAAVTAVVLAFSTTQGITRDESFYMDAGERHVRYYEDALRGRLAAPWSDEAIRRYWSYNCEHPPLWKTLGGLSWRALHRCRCAEDRDLHPEVARLASGRHGALGLLPEVTAFRLPSAMALGLLCALLYLFYREALGGAAGGLLAAGLMLAQPRAFFHAQTAAMDLPVATLWFAATYAYWRALRRGTVRAALLLGVVFGLLLATKLHSFFLPIALGGHWIERRLRSRRTGLPPPSPRPLLAMAVVGPLVLLLLWPWLWHDAFARFTAYLSYHWHHGSFDFEYLGRNYNAPPFPWHAPLVQLLLTAPVVTLALAAAGVFLLARRPPPGDAGSTRSLLLWAGVLPIVPFLSGGAPLYGETKHWLAVMPFLALAAAFAAERLAKGLAQETRLGRVAASSVVLALAFAPAAVETWHSHPYGLSHYNALAGGAPGGADLGMNRQFWGYAVRGTLPWLNRELPRGARVDLHDCSYDAYLLYLRDGELRRDIGHSQRPRNADAALVVHEKHCVGAECGIWQAYGHVRPATVLTKDGVPLVSVYRSPPGPPHD